MADTEQLDELFHCGQRLLGVMKQESDRAAERVRQLEEETAALTDQLRQERAKRQNLIEAVRTLRLAGGTSDG